MSIEKLSTNASLKEVMDKFEEISFLDFLNINITYSNELPSEANEGHLHIVTDYSPSHTYLQFEKPLLQENDVYIKMEQANPNKNFKICSTNKTLTIKVRNIIQMQNGIEVALNGYIREGGEWISLSSLAFNIFVEGEGDIIENTGGFSTSAEGSNSGSGSSVVEISSSNIYLYATSISSSTGHSGIASKKTIDVTDKNKLVIDGLISTSVTSSGIAYCKIGFDKSTALNAQAFVLSKTFGHGYDPMLNRIEIDISSLKGAYYFKALGVAAYGSSSVTTIYNMWLE